MKKAFFLNPDLPAAFVLILASAPAGFAEEITLKGLVQDTSHNNLPGVTVTHPGSSESVVSDERGEFTLKVNQEGGKPVILNLSKSDYLPLEFPVKEPEKRLEPHLTPIIDNNGISAGVIDVSKAHAIHGGITEWLNQNDRDKQDGKLDDGLFDAWKKASRFQENAMEQVRYRLRLPEKTAKLQGALLISEHGMGTKMMEHQIFWDFADKNGYALIGFLGNPIQRGIYPASKLEEIIAMIGEKFEHPELAQVPYITFGHSNGTGFSAFYPALRPERTICWISYHSGGTWHLEFPGVERTPGLVMHGTNDQFLKGQDETVMELRTQRNAPITMVMEAGMAHWPSDPDATYKLIADFSQACIDTRTQNGETQFRPLEESLQDAWLGDVFDRSKDSFQEPEIAPAATYQGDKQKANYLPNEAFAKAWQRFRATGK
tara:strand:+ start:2822 stop:4117 length:1296 start_codon:yes stop_codon:yes gene_type:complete